MASRVGGGPAPRLLRAVERELAARRDDDLLRRLAALRADLLDRLDDVHAVEPGRLGRAEEELGPVRAGARVGHAQHAGSRVLQPEVLVLELLAVDRLAARAVLVREVAALAHEAGDDAVEQAALVAVARLARAELPEVVGRLRHDVLAQLHDDAAPPPRRPSSRRRRPWGCRAPPAPGSSSSRTVSPSTRRGPRAPGASL